MGGERIDPGAIDPLPGVANRQLEASAPPCGLASVG
jgi:hypothetical protein